MVTKDRLYQTFGELFYVVAIADGVIQEEEVEALINLLEEHPKAKQIKWSFDYEKVQKTDVEALYKKTFHVLSDVGPNEEYEFLLESLQKIADASDGIVPEEDALITKFSRNLIAQFVKDLK